MTDQIIGKGFNPPPVAEEGAILFDDKPLDLRCLRFHILIVDSIISDQGVCHDHDLTFVRRIGKDLLVSCHAGVEDEFPRFLSGEPEGSPFEYSPILQGQYGFWVIFHSILPVKSLQLPLC
jgi:hypothetical protein